MGLSSLAPQLTGAVRVRGWRLRPRTVVVFVSMPMADGRSTEAVDFDSASVTDDFVGCRAVRTKANAQPLST